VPGRAFDAEPRTARCIAAPSSPFQLISFLALKVSLSKDRVI